MAAFGLKFVSSLKVTMYLFDYLCLILFGASSSQMDLNFYQGKLERTATFWPFSQLLASKVKLVISGLHCGLSK